MNETHHEDYTETRALSERFAMSSSDILAARTLEAERAAAEYAQIQADAANARHARGPLTAEEEQQRKSFDWKPHLTALNAIEKELREAPPENPLAALLVERNQRHGEFTDDAKVSQRLKLVMRDAKNWDGLNHIQREALEHIATKIGRILSGDPNHKDHWEDIQGYARLVETRL